MPIILFLALIFTRLVNLSTPPGHYFDEVYHAFTAQEMAKGNIAAWEWWHQAPAGFAYEWTHPPLAKLAMVTGLKIVGNSPLGWRLPGALLGIFAGIFLYASVYKLSHSKKVALLTLFLYTFDGLPLVMSRIGMNDIYLVFFLISSFYYLVSKRPLMASIMYGLALASKWSAIYFLPIFIYFIWKTPLYLFLPLLIYLATYLPFLLTHSWDKFIELQKQMWWYHTGLKATHSYSSPAITWPMMYRPVWAHVKYLSAQTANIYIQGNPLIWWFGLVAVGYQTLKKNLAAVGYWIFLAPWIFSPRIMFLYHYLPSLVFLYIILAQSTPKKLICISCALYFISFLFFSPRYFGIPVPNQFLNYFLWLPSWR